MAKKHFLNQKLGKQTSRRQTLAKWKTKVDLQSRKQREKIERS
jgi:hypothetical protein